MPIEPSLVAPLPMQEKQVQFLGWEDPMEKKMATHSSILAWEIPWTEEPEGIQSMGSQGVSDDWLSVRAHTVWHSLPHVVKGKRQCLAGTEYLSISTLFLLDSQYMVLNTWIIISEINTLWHLSWIPSHSEKPIYCNFFFSPQTKEPNLQFTALGLWCYPKDGEVPRFIFKRKYKETSLGNSATRYHVWPISPLNPGGTHLVPNNCTPKAWPSERIGSCKTGWEPHEVLEPQCPLVGKSSHSTPQSQLSCKVPGPQFPKGLWDRPQGAATKTCRAVFLTGKYKRTTRIPGNAFLIVLLRDSHTRSLKWVGISQWVGSRQWFQAASNTERTLSFAFSDGST